MLTQRNSIYLLSSSLHYLQWYSIDLMMQSCVLLQARFKVHQQCSKVCSSQIQGEILSMFWKKITENNTQVGFYEVLFDWFT